IRSLCNCSPIIVVRPRSIRAACVCRFKYTVVSANRQVTEISDHSATCGWAETTVYSITKRGLATKGDRTMETSKAFTYLSAEPCPNCGLRLGQDGHGAQMASMMTP